MFACQFYISSCRRTTCIRKWRKYVCIIYEKRYFVLKDITSVLISSFRILTKRWIYYFLLKLTIYQRKLNLLSKSYKLFFILCRSIASSDSFTRPVEKVDLAAALIALKTRHSLSAVCINDICSLLCILNVPDAPRSWFHVNKALVNPLVSPLDRK